MTFAAYDQHSALLDPIPVPVFASGNATSEIINEKGFLSSRWAKDHGKGAFLNVRFNQPDRRRHIVQPNALKKLLFLFRRAGGSIFDFLFKLAFSQIVSVIFLLVFT